MIVLLSRGKSLSNRQGPLIISLLVLPSDFAVVAVLIVSTSDLDCDVLLSSVEFSGL